MMGPRHSAVYPRRWRTDVYNQPHWARSHLRHYSDSPTHATMKPNALTPEQRKEIDRRRKGTLDRFLYERLTAVLAVAAGHTPEEVAEFLGVGLTQLGEWLRVYRNEGLDALRALAREEPVPSDH